MKYLKLSVEVLEYMEALPAEEMAALLKNLKNYAVTGKEPEIEDRTERVIFDLFKGKVVDRQREISNKRRIAGKERERENKKEKAKETKKERSKEKRKEKEKEKTIEKERGGTPPARRTPEAAAPQTPAPTRREIIDFCKKEGYAVDADRFYDYYSANGWKTGGSRITDWRAKVRYWESVDKSKSAASAAASPPKQEGSFDTDEFFNAALERVYGDLPKV